MAHHMLTGSHLCPQSPGPRAPCSCLPLVCVARARNWRNGSRILSPLCRDMCPGWEEPCSASTCSPGSPDDRDLPSHCSLGAGGLWHGQRSGGEGWYVTVEPEAADSTEGESTVCLCLDTKTETIRSALNSSGHFRHFSLFDPAETLLTSNQNTR